MLDPSAPPKITAGLLPTPPGKPRFRHLSGPEMDERKEKGLCFNCDQRWSHNLVLGVQWLKHIGLVLMNYSTMSLTFLYNNSTIELHGDTTPHSMSLHSFNKLTRIEPEAQLFSFHISNPDTNLIHPPPNTGPEPIPTLPDLATLEPQVQTIITQYSHLFSEPSALPPPRITDHTIPLAPHASPVKVQPYRYPHSQKHEIEKQVAKLISTGWIQPNTSPFSSPVL